VKLIIDENLPPRWCDYLAPHGFTATHWTCIGQFGDPDDAIFEYSSEHGSIIVTQDLDFTRMLALRGTSLPSVIQLRVGCPVPEMIGPTLLEILTKHRESLLSGCLITLDLDRHRIRLLPLHS
jgi:predicted nuclease of predicted toxin-antitoxin system